MKFRLSVLIVICLACGCTSMRPVDDRWMGRDKVKHFWVSGAISGATTAVAKNQDVDDAGRFAIAMGVTLSFGIGKEAHDLRVNRGWSWKDIVWDIVGGLTGYAVVEAMD